jgi:hypothetical protein
LKYSIIPVVLVINISSSIMLNVNVQLMFAQQQNLLDIFRI